MNLNPQRIISNKNFNFVYYQRRNNKLREMLKNLLKKVLKLIFGKKYFHIFNKIKVNNKKLRIFLFSSDISLKDFLIKKIYFIFLKLKYLGYRNAPFNHLGAMNVLDKLISVNKNLNIKFFLVAGSLLGVARGQNCIAGSAADIDLGVCSKDLNKLENLENKLRKMGLLYSRKWPKRTKNYKLISFFFQENHIDISIYSKKKINGKYFWCGEGQKSWTNSSGKPLLFNEPYFKKFKIFDFYNNKFLGPINPNLYLKKKYGKEWTKFPANKINLVLKKKSFYEKLN